MRFSPEADLCVSQPSTAKSERAILAVRLKIPQSSYLNSRLKPLKFAALSMEVESLAIYGN
jgi:hypothetical protein